MIDEEDWSAMEVDVKGAAFEGLLEKSAAEGKKGAGQYFTPRVLIKMIVNVMQPDPCSAKEYKICDPACGTSGFLIRDDFTVSTSNKQLNFIQHVVTILKPSGRAAMVLPDNVLFSDQADDVFKYLMEDFNVHTVLRIPNGTFTPYSQGVKANVIFFQKGLGLKTENCWIHDCRTNIPCVTKKNRPLTADMFAGFEK